MAVGLRLKSSRFSKRRGFDMARFDLNDALQNTKPAPGRRFSLDDAMAEHGQAAPDQFKQTSAGIRQTQSERLPVNPSLPEGWQHNAAMVGSSLVKGVAGIPDSIIQTPRNVINLSKAGAGAQLMGLAAVLQKGLGIGGGPEAMLDTLHTLGLDDTPSNPIPYVPAIPAHPVTSGIDAGLQAVTGRGLEQPQTAAGAIGAEGKEVVPLVADADAEADGVNGPLLANDLLAVRQVGRRLERQRRRVKGAIELFR